MRTHMDRNYFKKSLEELKPKPITSLDIDATVIDVITLLQKQRFGSLILLKEKKLHAIITEKDFLFKMGLCYEDSKNQPALNFATIDPFCLSFSHTIEDCIVLMTKLAIRHIPIIREESGEIFMISIHDVLSFLINDFKDDLVFYGTVQRPLVDGVYFPDENILEDKKVIEGVLDNSLFATTLNRVVSDQVIIIDLNANLCEMIEKMQLKLFSVAIVVEYETSICGIITERDLLLRVFNKVDFYSTDYKVSDFMTTNPHCLFENHTVGHAVNNMFTFHYRNIILMDRDQYPLSVLGLNDILNFLVRGLHLDNQFDFLGGGSLEKNNG